MGNEPIYWHFFLLLLVLELPFSKVPYWCTDSGVKSPIGTFHYVTTWEVNKRTSNLSRLWTSSVNLVTKIKKISMAEINIASCHYSWGRRLLEVCSWLWKHRQFIIKTQSEISLDKSLPSQFTCVVLRCLRISEPHKEIGIWDSIGTFLVLPLVANQTASAIGIHISATIPIFNFSFFLFSHIDHLCSQRTGMWESYSWPCLLIHMMLVS